jgi:hypothetical protein
MEIQKFLAQVASTIESGAFVSVKDAKAKGVMSTGEDASWALIDGQPSYNEAHETLADEALAYFRAYEGDNAFLKGLRTLATFDEIGVAQAERAAWIIPAYQRNNQEATPNGFGADSEFVSEVGAEHAFRGSVASLRMVNTRFGPKQIVTLIDKANNVFTYWPSNRVLALTVGDSVRAVGKIKAHSVYNGVKQNVLTRAKIAVVPTAA